MSRNRITPKPVLFYGGPFCQWYVAHFHIDGVCYNCAEQWMMAQKARLFGDRTSLKKIMAATSPAEQKALGKRVRGFKRAMWEAVARDVVVRGNLAKFSAHPFLRSELLRTDDRLIVEASPSDVIWGVGLGEEDPRACDPTQWLGRNWLGYALMEVRDALRTKLTSIEGGGLL